MRRPIVVALLSAALLALVAVPTFRLAAQSGGEYVPDRQVLFPANQRSALSMDEYLSPAVATPRPFSHILVRHDASVPPGAMLTLFVRASLDGATWTDWATLEEDDDMWSETDGPDVHWSQIVDVGALAGYWQVRAEWSAGQDGLSPILRQIDINTVNTLIGPDPVAESAPETKSRSAELAAALPKPAVVSRTSWGSPDGQGSRAAPHYRAVTHMVVHHTADSNTLTNNEPNWAARVRAIWSYHTIARGWGDIGYNYLIDPNGVIYEGRAGGDNAVAFHDTANYGSMGVAMLGTYSSVTPSQATQDALVALLSWKASQRDIDPQGSSSYYGCLLSRYCQPYHSDGIVAHISGHREVTPNHTTCPGSVSMSLLSTIRQRVAEAVAGGGGTPPPEASATLTSVQYSRTTLAAGEVLQVALTVRNTGQTTISGQAPSVDPAGTDAANAYVYRQNECFDSDAVTSSPPYPKESGRFRVVLGTPDWDAANAGRCVGATGNYPWRWGLNGDLAPGQEQTIIGYVEFFTPGHYTIQAGLVQEYVAYHSRDLSPTTITVTAEDATPDAGAFDANLQPQAQVYRLGSTPDSLLQRVGDPLSVERGEYVGSFPWSGEFIDWSSGGPLGLTDQFMIVQARSFVAPTSGLYTFRTISDDGSWLLVDGTLVVNNYGMHPSQPAMGTIPLNSGIHTIGYVYFDRSGFASSGYDVQMPGAAGFQLVPDGMSNIPHVGDIFTDYPAPVLVADDAGGSGVATIRWRVNGSEWQDQVGPVLAFGKLQIGRYVFEYQAIDLAGNQGPVRVLSFGVDPQAKPSGGNYHYHTFLPLVER